MLQSFIFLWFTCLYTTGQPASSSGQNQKRQLISERRGFCWSSAWNRCIGLSTLSCKSGGAACSADHHYKHSKTEQCESASREQGIVAGREPLLMHSQSWGTSFAFTFWRRSTIPAMRREINWLSFQYYFRDSKQCQINFLFLWQAPGNSELRIPSELSSLSLTMCA